MMNRLLIISFLFLKIISYGQVMNEDLRQIIYIEASIDGTIKWTAVGENSKLPYVIE